MRQKQKASRRLGSVVSITQHTDWLCGNCSCLDHHCWNISPPPLRPSPTRGAFKPFTYIKALRIPLLHALDRRHLVKAVRKLVQLLYAVRQANGQFL